MRNSPYIVREAVQRQLTNHKKWLDGASDGAPASIVNVNLFGFDFTGQDMREIILSGSSLQGARFVGTDLSGAILINADLRGASFRNATLVKADLSGANLAGAQFDGADLRDVSLKGAIGVPLTDKALIESGTDTSTFDGEPVNFTRARMHRANITDAQLAKAVFSKADLSGANLSRTSLPRARMGGAVLRNANADRADLSGADMSNVFAAGANFSGANLSGANLENANMIGTRTRDANLDGARTVGAKFAPPADIVAAELQRALVEHDRWVRSEGRSGNRASLDGVDLSESDLRGLNLSGADLRGAQLQRVLLNDALMILADLAGANLTGASLVRCNLSGANMVGTLLADADLTDAVLEAAPILSQSGGGDRSGPADIIGRRGSKRGHVGPLVFGRRGYLERDRPRLIWPASRTQGKMAAPVVDGGDHGARLSGGSVRGSRPYPLLQLRGTRSGAEAGG